VLGLLTLAGQLFVAAAIYAVILARTMVRSTTSLRSVRILTGGFALPLLVYLVMNFFLRKHRAGEWSVKSTFLRLTIQNARTAAHVIRRSLAPRRRSDFWRVFQLAVPGMAALLAPFASSGPGVPLATSLGV
jgi:hypothetical protein